MPARATRLRKSKQNLFTLWRQPFDMARVLFSAQTSTAGGKLYFLATLSLVKYQRALPAVGSRGKAPCGVSGAKPLTTSVSNESRRRSCFAEQNMFLRFVPKRFFSIMVRARRAKGFCGLCPHPPPFEKGGRKLHFLTIAVSAGESFNFFAVLPLAKCQRVLRA